MAQTRRLGSGRVGTGGRDVVCVVSSRLDTNCTWSGKWSGALRPVAVLGVNRITRSFFSFVFVLLRRRNTHAWMEQSIGNVTGKKML
jgi:hypothetical protein